MHKLSEPHQGEELHENGHERCAEENVPRIQRVANMSLWKIWTAIGLLGLASAEKAEGRKFDVGLDRMNHSAVADPIHSNIRFVASNKENKVQDDKVDLIEINHFHNDQGRPVFDQIIFYDWSMEDNRYHVRDWRLLKNVNQRPMFDAATGEYIAVWSDSKSRDVIRKTRSKLFDETWTMYDPELIERNFLPEGKRRKLREPPPRMSVVGSPQPQPSPQQFYYFHGVKIPVHGGDGR